MKKYIILVSLLSLGLVAFSVWAKSDQSQSNEVKKLEQSLEKLEKFELPDVESTKTNPSSLFFGPQGQARIISGEIVSVGTTTPVVDGVKIWGIVLTVDMTNAKFIPAGTTVSDIKVGDKVNIKGTVDNSGKITASIVHSLTVRQQQNITEIQARILELIKKIRELQQKLGLSLTPLP